MSVEIEKKYRLTDEQVAHLEDELAAAAADFICEEFEENTIYGGGVLDETRAILRIRMIGDRAILTYKRRIVNDSDIKQQVEHESEFGNALELREIIANLGFKARLIYEKRRKTWRMRGVEVVLDQLPFGKFMEIEGPVVSIREVEMILGAEDLVVEHETYPRLTARLGTKTGEVIEARFTAE